MTIQELFVRANEELAKVIMQIKDDQWDIQMPAGLTSKPATLKESVNYHTYDDAWVPDVLACKTKDEVGTKYDDLLQSTDTKADYAKHNAIAISAVRNFNELENIVHLSYGDFSANDYLQHIISFRGMRIYDISKLIGTDSKMADDLVEGLHAEFEPVIDNYRQMGIFPPAIAVADDADPQTKLMAMFGRA
jgi:hypothetical protein